MYGGLRGAAILGGAPNVTAHSLTGRRRRRSVCCTRNPHDTVSSLSATPSRAAARTHALPLRPLCVLCVISVGRARYARVNPRSVDPFLPRACPPRAAE